MLDQFPFSSGAGLPALFGLIFLFLAAYFFRRPYIAIAAGILGTLLGMGLHKTGKIAQAVEAYELALKYKPNTLAAYKELGLIAKKIGRKKTALEMFRRFLNYNPTNEFIRGEYNKLKHELNLLD